LFIDLHLNRGELISGNLGKKTLGGDSKSGLFYVLIRDFGSVEAIRCMSRLAKLCARFLADRGFSIGVEDVTPSARITQMKSRILSEGQKLADEQIEAYKSGRIKLKPGCDALQSLESEVNGLLGKIRENCGKEALGALHHRNAPLCMAQCGSKGSPLNISQMIACLGQQSVGGSRIQDGFVGRTLPHFPIGALYPAAKGFVANSFFSGLTATEFFFHTMGGREGLVDTAVKTAETGYMARRLMKALEDLSMQYDNTVRNSEQTVVQFSYGDDGLNPQVSYVYVFVCDM
jgi:DNA-directed RNA polymerase III subunit RPC1